MMHRSSSRSRAWAKPEGKRASGGASSSDIRTRVFRGGMLFFALFIAAKLFSLQVVDHAAYAALAEGQHEIFEELFPKRGSIFFHDSQEGTLVTAATNQKLAFVYTDPRHIKDPEATATTLATLFGFDEEKTASLKARLSNTTDPFEPVQREVPDSLLDQLKALKLPGVSWTSEDSRLYPESGTGGHLLGFVGSDNAGGHSGKYGVEGYFEDILAGTPGFLRSERDISGRLIAVGDRSLTPAVDGSDVVLTIDRTIQYVTCSALEQAVRKHGADGGSVIVLEPSTGKILAMCGYPDFDPNHYGDAADINTYNNPAIFDAYEPGSVFKAITVAAGIDAGAILPSTTFNDTGSIMLDDWPKPITNAEGKVYGTIDMTTALEQSVNTGMIFAMRAAGQERFTQYVKNFGFGVKTGIELETESAGTIASLELGPEIYAATASFGQGITVTPLQIAAAYGALANGGVLKQPYVVDEIRHADGTVEPHKPVDIRRVISAKTSRLVGAMLVSVIEHGHGKLAGVPGYYIGGKTGTAQVARTDGLGYDLDNTIGSFAGFGPIEDPKFVIVARIDHPRDVQWAESTAAPLFGEIAKFLVNYFEIPPTR